MSHDAPSEGLDLPALVAALERAAAERGPDDATALLLRPARDALLAKQQEADTERSRYRNLFDAVPDPVSIIAEDGTVLDLNKAGMQAYKRPREEIVGRNINVLNPDLPLPYNNMAWMAATDPANKPSDAVLEWARKAVAGV